MIKNFFNISDLSSTQLEYLIHNRAIEKSLNGKNIGLIFEKYSTRTRLSFNVCINQLKGNVIDIRLDELNISRDESFEDTFKAMACYLDGLVFRTTSHQRLMNASKFFQKPVINALSDLSHPCQIVSDLFTLYEHFKSLDLNILWIGDMNNVCFSLVEAARLINSINLYICSSSKIINENQWSLSSNTILIDNIQSINLSKINCVMTDVFISMNDEIDENKVNDLKSFIVDKELMDKTHKKSVFMHCLPAKVGFEVSEEVIKGPKSIVWRQAYNRMLAQKNILQLIDFD